MSGARVENGGRVQAGGGGVENVLPNTKEVQALRAEVGVPEAAKAVGGRLLATGDTSRVAVAQISTDPGDIRGNTIKILKSINDARASGAEIVVFPELTIPGYASMDLFLDKDYLRANMQALQKIREASAGMTIIVGFAEWEEGKARAGGRPVIFNSAAVIHDGKIVDIVRKTLLPNYEIFFEDRYFLPAETRRVVSVGGRKLGIEICEDLWSKDYPVDPTNELVAQGAQIIINLSASPFHAGKVPVRAGLVSNAAKGYGVPFIYANLVGSYDGYEGEVVFDGRSMVMNEKGKLTGFAKGFKEDLMVLDLHHAKELELPQLSEVAEIHDALVLGIRDYFRRVDKRCSKPMKAIIGLSGGIDSALVAALTVEAIGKDRVIGITMPTKYNSSETRGDAKALADNLGISFKTMPIQTPYQVMLESLGGDPEYAAAPAGTSDENLQARIRMMYLMAYGNRLGGIVVNTGNKTELALDNMTMYGDTVGGFSVLGDLDKDRVYTLSRYINERAGRELIPQTTIDRVPSAELKENQTDAMVMGDHPQVLAPYLREIVEQSMPLSEALVKFEGKLPPSLIKRMYRRLDNSEWKRRQIPPGIRATPHAFGNGRRVPIGHGFHDEG